MVISYVQCEACYWWVFVLVFLLSKSLTGISRLVRDTFTNNSTGDSTCSQCQAA